MSDEREPDAANEKPKLPAKPSPAAACPDCGGSGRIVLLISTRPCARCGGTGRLDAAAAGETPGPDEPNPGTAAAPGRPDAAAGETPRRTIQGFDPDVVRTFTYDPHGRLTRVTLTRLPCRGEATAGAKGG